MSTVLDVDVLLLYATALTAKKGPAQLVDVLAAIDLVQKRVPGEEKLGEAFARLGKAGLLQDVEGRVGLTAAAEALVSKLPRKGEHAELLFELRGLLGSVMHRQDGAPLEPGADALNAAIAEVVANRAAIAAGGKNLFVPKPAPDTQSRPGQRQRKPLPRSPAKSRKR